MRSETKTVWIADSGAEFTSEMACLIYEAGEGLLGGEAAEIAARLAERGYALRLTHVESAPAPEPELAPGGWIEWAGGDEAPTQVSPGSTIEARLRSGQTLSSPAYDFRWNCSGQRGDIVAYRVVKEA